MESFVIEGGRPLNGRVNYIPPDTNTGNVQNERTVAHLDRI